MSGSLTSYPVLSEAEKLAEAGRMEEAAQAAMAHLRAQPNEPRGLALLGQIAMHMGALGQAEHFLRQAIARGLSDYNTRHTLGSVLNQQDRPADALPMFDQLEKETGDPAISALRAMIFDKTGRSDEALGLREKLTKAHPHDPHHWITYGDSLRSSGRVDDAIAAYRKAVEADPDGGEAWWPLASIKKPVFTDDDLTTMQKLLEGDARTSARLHFALARAYHDRSDYKTAFDHYEEANRLRAEDIGYDASELTAEVAEVERVATSDYPAFAERPSLGDDRPIFIVSLPRSGSTLLEQMLGSHPMIEPVGELPYISAILRTVMEMATRRGAVTVPQVVASLTDDQAAAMGHDYLKRAAIHRKSDAPYFLDKLPHNWSNILFIKRILPQAIFIDIRRPAMDCCFSNFTQSFSTAHASSFALRDIGQCYVDYVRVMDHLDRVMPGLVHHIAYDHLIENPEPAMRTALDHIGLDWDPAILDFHRTDRAIRTPSSEQVRRPLNREGMDIWKPYAEWLGPLRETLGSLAD